MIRRGAAVGALLCVIAVAASSNFGSASTTARSSQHAPTGSALRKTFPGLRIDGRHSSARQIVVKFREGSAVHVKDTVWVGDDEPASGFDARALAASHGINRAIRDEAVRSANRAVAAAPGARLAPLIDVPADVDLRELRADGEARSHKTLADLSLYSSVLLRRPNAAAAQRLVQKLATNPAVEQVYPQPIFRDADIPPTTTIDLRPSQNYLNPAPAGIDVPFARRFFGGRGEGVSVSDVEAGWVLDHEDLPGPEAVVSSHGINLHSDHGTAVAGELWGVEDSIGVTGISPASRIGVSSVVGAELFPNPIFNPAAAIVNAAANLNPGDVILIEQHAPLLLDGIAFPTDSCNPDQIGYLPVEVFGAEFDAISEATARGIVVVEAAGNGTMDLNAYPEFDRTARDSGAIIVGASVGGGSNTPACYTNNGNRVDAYAWGDGVATLGGDHELKANGEDARQWYTSSFSGTSSASPMVAGSVALIQAIRKSRGMPVLTPREMRSLVRSTGTPQGPGVPIGTQPNLQAALRAMLPDSAVLRIPDLPRAIQPGETITGTVTARNTGGRAWTPLSHRIDCNWEESNTSVAVNPSAPSASVDYGDTFQAKWTTIVPTAPAGNTFTLRCALITGGTVLASTTAAGIASSANQFNADITEFRLPASSRFSVVEPQPATGHITVRNTGTQDWTAQWLPQLELRSSPKPASTPLPGPVAAGATATVEVDFFCQSAGPNTFTVRMTFSGVPIGAPKQATTTCLRG